MGCFVRLMGWGSVENSLTQVTHLKFVDDTLILCDVSDDNIIALKWALRWFEIIFGLKINFSKCGW